MRTAAEIVIEVDSLLHKVGSREPALKVIQNWGCEIVDEVNTYIDSICMDEIKQRIKENRE